ncbi:MAG TPA: PQQ-dependent dehydrogenase, methanol/ethanol family, partial [Rhizobiales bacterium]|nr:PQQ-dependent dehydrogenase, methanol/ethanol family [Hyphomicrobiales bacterium]
MNMKFGVLAGSIIAVMMGLSGQAMAGSDEEQLARMKDPDQWPAPGRDFSLTRHSDLAEINTKNIGKLQLVWLQSQNNLRGQEGQPLVIKDVGGKTMLFMVSGCAAMVTCNEVQALDLTDPDNPKVVWNYVKQSDRDETAIPRACCDTVNR